MKIIEFKKYLVVFVILSSFVIVTKNINGCIDDGIPLYPPIVYPPAYFNIDIICLDTDLTRHVYAMLITHELKKIGIGVNSIEFLSYKEIAQRTWDYNGEFPVPTHQEGGFDLLFWERNWDIEIDPVQYYHSNYILPNGSNIYQYENQDMNWALGNYINYTLFNDDTWLMAQNIQELLYDDLPAITILYGYAFYYMKENISEINYFLWNKKAETMANWNHSAKSDLFYGINYEFEEFYPISSKLAVDNNDFQWLNQIYDSLIERSMDAPSPGAFGNRISTNYSSSNGKIFYIEIDSNAKWADGTKLNTTDVEYSFDLYENLTKPYYWNPHLDWDIYNVTIIDEHNIKVEIIGPVEIFAESKLAVPLLPYHIWKDIDYSLHAETAKYWARNNPEKLFGAGPYKLESYDEENKKIHLTKNQYYKNLTNAEDPLLSELYFVYYSSKTEAIDALDNGQIDMIDSSFEIYPEEISIPGVIEEMILDYSSEEIVVNMNHPYIGTGELTPLGTEDAGKYLRKAISHAIPRTHIIDTVLNGHAIPGITPWPLNQVMTHEDLEPYEYILRDINAGFLEQAGFVYPCASNTANLLPGTIISSVLFVTIIRRKRKKRFGNE